LIVRIDLSASDLSAMMPQDSKIDEQFPDPDHEPADSIEINKKVINDDMPSNRALNLVA